MRPTTPGTFPHPPARPLLRGVLAVVPVLLVGGAYADPASAATPDRRGRASVAAHDDPGCGGRAASTVSGTFSAQVSGLSGPLVAVVVRNGSGVVTTALTLVDQRGNGCADLPALDPGRYTLTASDRRQRARTAVRVVGSSAVTPTPTPVPLPPTPTPTPTPPTPTPPTPAPTPPAPTPTSLPTPPSSTPQPVPLPRSTARPTASSPGAGVPPGSTGPAPDGAGTPGAPVPRPGSASASGGASSALAGAASPTAPTPTAGTATDPAYAGGPPAGGAAEEASGWRLAAQVAAVLVGATLVVALLALVQSRSTGRWDQDG